MRLKLIRSQRTTGMVNKKVLFILNAEVSYSSVEQASIKKYNLGSQIIYNSEAARRHAANAASGGLIKGLTSAALSHMSLSITIDSLARGHEVECKDLDELLEAEEAIRGSCENLIKYLEVAECFDGREEVVEY